MARRAGRRGRRRCGGVTARRGRGRARDAPHRHPECFGPAYRKAATSHQELDRIAERRDSDQLDVRPRHEAELQQSSAERALSTDALHDQPFAGTRVRESQRSDGIRVGFELQRRFRRRSGGRRDLSLLTAPAVTRSTRAPVRGPALAPRRRHAIATGILPESAGDRADSDGRRRCRTGLARAEVSVAARDRTWRGDCSTSAPRRDSSCGRTS